MLISINGTVCLTSKITRVSPIYKDKISEQGWCTFDVFFMDTGTLSVGETFDTQKEGDENEKYQLLVQLRERIIKCLDPNLDPPIEEFNTSIYNS